MLRPGGCRGRPPRSRGINRSLHSGNTKGVLRIIILRQENTATCHIDAEHRPSGRQNQWSLLSATTIGTHANHTCRLGGGHKGPLLIPHHQDARQGDTEGWILSFLRRKASKWTTRPPGAACCTSSTEGKGMRPIDTDDAALSGISGRSAGCSGANGSDMTFGVSPPQPPTSRRTTAGASQRLINCFDQVTETVKIRLELLRNNPSQDAGFHQRCQDPW